MPYEIRLLLLFFLNCLKHLIRNKGLMGVGIEIPIHEAFVFNLSSHPENLSEGWL